MAVRISTAALDTLRPFVEKATSQVADMSSGNMVDDFTGTLQNAVANYMTEMNNADMRRQRAINPWANAAIMNRRDQVQDAEISLITKDGQEKTDDERELELEIMRVLEAQSEFEDNEGISHVSGPAIDDALTINKGAIQQLLFDTREPRGLKVLDGNKIQQNPDFKISSDGLAPKGVPRYLYRPGDRLPEAPPIEFDNDEIILLAPYALSYDAQGLAPMRSLKRILQAELDVFTWLHRTQQQGSPGGVFITPGAAPGTPDRMKNLYELKLAGKAGLAFMTLPEKSRYIELGSVNAIQQGTFQFYEILMKATAIAFRTTPFHLGWDSSASLSNSSDAQMEFNDDGIISLLRYLRGIYNRKFMKAWGERANNLYLTYSILEAEEEIMAAPELRALASNLGFASMNDLKIKGGFKSYSLEELEEMLKLCKITDISAEELWPYVSQEWVPALQGTSMTTLPLVYAFRANKKAADAPAGPPAGSAPEHKPSENGAKTSLPDKNPNLLTDGTIASESVDPIANLGPVSSGEKSADNLPGKDHINEARDTFSKIDDIMTRRLRNFDPSTKKTDKDDEKVGFNDE